MSSDPGPANGNVMGGHHSSEELAAYLSGGFSQEARDGFERHIAECRTCRIEAMSARRLLEHSRPKTRRWLVPSAMAAALAIAFFSRSTTQDLSDEATRSDSWQVSEGNAGRLSVVAPTDGSTVPGIPVFVWRAHVPDALYRVAVSEPGGVVAWSGETSDTTISPPALSALNADTEYLWTVDAIDPDGVTVTTGVHRFRILK